MGLDGVEMIMATEEEFQITLSDLEAGKIITVGDLYSQVLSKLGELRGIGCLTSHSFYKLRRTLIKVLGIQRHQLFPQQPMEIIFPKQCRRAQWKKLTEQLNFRLPELQRPKWFSRLLTIGVLFWLAGSILGNILGFFSPLQAGISVILLWVCATMAYRLSEPLAVYWAPEITTLGEMTKKILRLNFGTTNSTVKQWNNDQEIWESLQRVIVEQLGVKSDEVVKSACFVEDLGVD